MDMLCKICGETKSATEFRKEVADGPYEAWNLRCCKACVHAEYLERYSDKKKREALQKSSSKWKKENPERHAELGREYRKRHPEKIIAQNRFNYAVRKGKIKRMPCEVCGAVEKVHGHHVSYEPKDWYNVRWLCFKCHKLEHEPPEYLKP